MVAHAPRSYFQHTSSGGGGSHHIAHADPSYFQSGYQHPENPSLVHGRKGHHGRTKHGRAGAHMGHRHGSPMPHIADPWKGKFMNHKKH